MNRRLDKQGDRKKLDSKKDTEQSDRIERTYEKR